VKKATRLVANWRRGRAQKTLAAATAASAGPLALEIYFEHYKGSFGDKWEWVPIWLTPAVVAAGIGGVLDERVAKTALPIASALYGACGVIGTFLHLRGVSRKPGGLTQEPWYNLIMGPPLLAPGSLTLVGALGMAAPLMKREK
jgi:hypothetical protein